MDKQTGKFIARIAENLPDMEASVMQDWIDDPLRLQGFLGGLNPLEKFALLADLGTITVPMDWVNQSEFAGVEFSTPTCVLKPGDRFWVRAHKQTIIGTTTSEERLAFLVRLNSHLVSASGVRLVHGDKKVWSRVPKGYWWFASFDEKERLPRDSCRRGDHRVPAWELNDGGDSFRLGYFECVWDRNSAILSFCDVPSEA